MAGNVRMSKKYKSVKPAKKRNKSNSKSKGKSYGKY